MKRKLSILAVVVALALLAAYGFAQDAIQNAGPAKTQGQFQKRQFQQHTIHDQNSDGICDVCRQPVGSGQKNLQGQKAKKGKHWGPGYGAGNQGVGPKDGTGYGAKSGNGTGPQDGSGAMIKTTKGKTPPGAAGGKSRRPGRP